jgi:hypothetical protein
MLSHMLSLVLGLAFLVVTVAVWYLMYNHKAPGRHILESQCPSAYILQTHCTLTLESLSGRALFPWQPSPYVQSQS